MTGWKRWSTGNCARNWNLAIWTNSICTTQNSSWRMRKILWDIEIQTDRPILARRSDLMIVNKKKKKIKNKTYQIVDFTILADHRVKIKGKKERVKYLDIARELKKLWNTKVTVIPIVIGVLGTTLKGLVIRLEELEIRGWVEAIIHHYWVLAVLVV